MILENLEKQFRIRNIPATMVVDNDTQEIYLRMILQGIGTNYLSVKITDYNDKVDLYLEQLNVDIKNVGTNPDNILQEIDKYFRQINTNY